MTTSCMSSFEQALHAGAITGTNACNMVDDALAGNLEAYESSPGSRLHEWYLRKRALHASASLRDRTRSLNTTTLLGDSMLLPEIETLGNTTSHKFSLDRTDIMADSPRKTLEKIATYASIEDFRTLLQFIAKNQDIASVLTDAAKVVHQIKECTSRKVTVLGEPEDSDYCVYINALLSVDSYDKAYELEEMAFNKVIEPNFDLVNFRIVLAFDTDSDD